MTVAIENEYGRFEADTEKEALALAREGARKARAEAKQREHLRNVARGAAGVKGFYILGHYLDGTMPPAWRFYPPHHPWAKSLYRNVPHEYGGRFRTTEFTTEGGTAKVDHYGYDLVGAVCGGAGYTIAYFLRDLTTSEVHCFALAVHEGEWASVSVTKIQPGDFPQAKEND